MPGAEPTLRVMVAADFEEVLRIQRAAFGIEAELYADSALPPLLETAAQLAADLSSSVGLVALLGDRLVGSVRVRVDGRTLHIGRLSVDPQAQRQGIGAALLARAERAAPADEALLFTGHLSAGNLRLYRRAGYREERREQVDEKVTLVHLRKQLGAPEVGQTR